jgi:hypothetical protein
MSKLKVNEIEPLSGAFIVSSPIMINGQLFSGGGVSGVGNLVSIKNIDTSDTPYEFQDTEVIIFADPSNGAITINLPNPVNFQGKWHLIKDSSGNCTAQNKITLSGIVNNTLIDGLNIFDMTFGFSSATIVSNGGGWFII